VEEKKPKCSLNNSLFIFRGVSIPRSYIQRTKRATGASSGISPLHGDGLGATPKWSIIFKMTKKRKVEIEGVSFKSLGNLNIGQIKKLEKDLTKINLKLVKSYGKEVDL